MIKRLRRQFVLVTTVLLSLMLAVIFVLIYTGTAQSMENQVTAALQDGAPMRPGRPGEQTVPVFSVMEQPDGSLLVSGSSYLDLNDGDVVRTLFGAAMDQEQTAGLLSEYDLRYHRSNSPMGATVLFADISAQTSALNALMWSLIFMGTAGVLAIWGISILLARWMVRPVERAWQEQRQFVADASHELKTPLTVILTNGELLASDHCLAEEQAQLSRNILTMGRRMRGLVEDLLQLARSDNGQTAEQMGPVDLSALVQEAILPFEPVYFEAGLALESQIAEGITVTGHGSQLRQVVEILLDNGQKYSQPGGTCGLSLSRQGKRAVLRFFSPGEPLTPEQCQDIFRRFYRVDEARTGDSFGLGLPIARSILAAHKGKITAQPGKNGNTFTVTL